MRHGKNCRAAFGGLGPCPQRHQLAAAAAATVVIVVAAAAIVVAAAAIVAKPTGKQDQDDDPPPVVPIMFCPQHATSNSHAGLQGIPPRLVQRQADTAPFQ